MRKILWTSSWIAGALFVLSAMILDSESSIPIITCIISGIWLIILLYANTIWKKGSKKKSMDMMKMEDSIKECMEELQIRGLDSVKEPDDAIAMAAYASWYLKGYPELSRLLSSIAGIEEIEGGK